MEVHVDLCVTNHRRDLGDECHTSLYVGKGYFRLLRYRTRLERGVLLNREAISNDIVVQVQ